MGIDTRISWTTHTFNPWWGCVKVSPACDECYAERDSKRYGHAVWGKDAPRRQLSDHYWQQPLKWNELAFQQGIRERVFSGSMCDVMEDRSDLAPLRMRLYNLIENTPQLDWQLLTKRPQNFVRFLPSHWLAAPRTNVWLMTTVESQEYVWRLVALLKTPAVIRGISYEPALGPLDLSTNAIPELWNSRLHWVIAGGESGPRARPSNPQWFRDVRDQCVSAGCAFHFKQWGEFVSVSEVAGSGVFHYFDDGRTVRRIGKKAAGDLLDGREWKEFPQTAFQEQPAQHLRAKEVVDASH